MKDLILTLEEYFTIEEFVSEDVYKKYGRKAWRFFDKQLLENILFIRQTLGSPITINNWHSGGKWQQRGLRENTSSIVSKKTRVKRLYLSAHTLGKAIDFDVKGMTAQEVRMWLVDNGNKLPHKIRVEKKVNWVHLDTACDWDMEEEVYLFNA